MSDEQPPVPSAEETPAEADGPSAGTAEPAEAPPAPPVGWLPGSATDLFGPGATADEAYDLLTVDVPADAWIPALTAARDDLGCSYFDWLSAVDEPGTGFRVCAHLADIARPGRVRRLVLRTTVPHEAAVLPTATEVYAGAGWHERETHEMFGVDFTGHPYLEPLLLPENFEGHPLRKDFVLAARVAKAWPGAKEPGESEHGGPKRRQMLPPGVPDPNEWGPLKGQLPPAPARPARGARAAGGARAAAGAAGERPARRTRTAGAGSASQQSAADSAQTPATDVGASAASPAAAPASTSAPAARPERPARRTRSASQGSASQQTAAQQAGQPSDKAPDEASGPATGKASGPAPAPTGSSDAPWHHARPAFEDEPKTGEKRASEAAPAPAPEAAPETEAAPAPAPEEKPASPEKPASEDTSEPPATTPGDGTGTGPIDAAEEGGTRP
ncbi:NADH-quinone oxidoreductase subunit C [Streptomyces chrestomyceticus]|uniref:NADH-quinone oxidoreductase subunit C n=1 Tax=Streptomyces chrestomyceticus TaxID=68185 RepID=UPI0036C67F31